MPRPSSLFVAASGVLAFACAPIHALDSAAAVDERDAGAGVSVDTSGSATDAGATHDASGLAPPNASSAGYRAACGDMSVCNPDDARGCMQSASTDAGTPDSGDPTDGGALACRALSDGDHARCAPAGPASEGATCVDVGGCAAGLACIEQRCTPTCCARSSTCGAGAACVLAPSGGQAFPWLPVCAPLRTCVFETPSPCPTGTQCGFGEDEGVRGCVRVGTAAEGASCESTPCATGLACVGAGSLRRCATLCTPNTRGAPCRGTERCRVHPALLGTLDVGYCAPAR